MENELHNENKRHNDDIAKGMLAAHHNVRHGTSQVNGSEITTASERDSSSVSSEIPSLVYGQEVNCFWTIYSIIVVYSLFELR